MKNFKVFISEQLDSLHFDIKHDHNKDGSIKNTHFVEKPHKGQYKRSGKHPLIYSYSHKSGNLYMSHHDLYAKREIMAKSESGQKAGAKPAVPNDMHHAHKVATEHYNKYKGDNLSYRERYSKNAAARGAAIDRDLVRTRGYPTRSSGPEETRSRLKVVK